MKKQTILLTGGGGAALPYLINGLQDKGYRVVVVDADSNASGLYLADRGYRVPLATAPEFIDVIRRICRNESVAALVPLVDEELVGVARLAEEEGIPLIGPQRQFTELCLDKFALMCRLAEVGVLVPENRLLSDGWHDLPFPLILKPRTGRGSRGLFLAQTPAALEAHLAELQRNPNETLVQTYVDGPEYTVSAVVWRDGAIRAVVPKEIVDKRGVTRLAITRRNEAITVLCRNIQERLAANGPFNVQLRIDRHGVPLPFEINPRLSTTVTLTQAAGVDELGAIVDLALGYPVTADAWQWREGTTLIRRTLDVFIDEAEYRTRRAQLDCLL